MKPGFCCLPFAHQCCTCCPVGTGASHTVVLSGACFSHHARTHTDVMCVCGDCTELFPHEISASFACLTAHMVNAQGMSLLLFHHVTSAYLSAKQLVLVKPNMAFCEPGHSVRRACPCRDVCKIDHGPPAGDQVGGLHAPAVKIYVLKAGRVRARDVHGVDHAPRAGDGVAWTAGAGYWKAEVCVLHVC